MREIGWDASDEEFAVPGAGRRRGRARTATT